MSTEKNIERIVSLMEQDDSVDAPADSIRWAKNLFRSRPKKSGIVKKILAALQTDIAAGKPIFGERSGAGAAARQMLFEAGDHAVDLRVGKGRRGTVSVRGQVLGEGTSECEVVVLRGGETVRDTRTDAIGQFDLGDVGAGQCVLVARLAATEIIIEDLDLA